MSITTDPAAHAIGAPPAAPVLEVSNLATHFFTKAGVVKAVNGVSFSVGRGKIMGLVGESGSGKSMTGYSLMGLIDAPGRVVEGSTGLSVIIGS